MLEVPSVGTEINSFLEDKKVNGSALFHEAMSASETMIQELKNNGNESVAIHAPELAPNFSLPDIHGNIITLSDLLAQGPVIITFYRGEFCPFCNIQLRVYQRTLERFKELGAELVAISPQVPALARKMQTDAGISYTMLSDNNNQLARQFGLVFKVPEAVQTVYAAFGISLEEYNGNPENELPIPATYVITPDFKIIYSFIDADFTHRAEPIEIMLSLKNYIHANK